MSCTSPICLVIKKDPETGTCSQRVIKYEGETMNVLRDVYCSSPDDKVVLVPCGKCQGCQESKSRQWSLRLQAEMKEPVIKDCKEFFCTLTYDDDHIPVDHSVDKAFFSSWMKRLRARLDYLGHYQLRFFASGEYGTHTLRPHYHVVIFTDCPKELLLDTIQKSWNLGFVQFSSISDSRALAYTAGYCAKKIGFQPPKGLAKEFIVMSRKPGLGALLKPHSDGSIYLSDGKVVKAPLYLLKRYGLADSDELPKIVDDFWQDFDRGVIAGSSESWSSYCEKKTRDKAELIKKKSFSKTNNPSKKGL